MKHTISILVENQAGVLARIAGLFARRAYNIDSLAVGVTEDEAAVICEQVQAMAPDAEVILLPGGQPVYHYIFSVE